MFNSRNWTTWSMSINIVMAKNDDITASIIYVIFLFPLYRPSITLRKPNPWTSFKIRFKFWFIKYTLCTLWINIQYSSDVVNFTCIQHLRQGWIAKFIMKNELIKHRTENMLNGVFFLHCIDVFLLHYLDYEFS